MTEEIFDHFDWRVMTPRGPMQLVWTKQSQGDRCVGPYCSHSPTSRGVGVEELLEGDGPYWWEARQWMRTGRDPAAGV